MSAIFLLPACFTYWPRKYTTRVDPHLDNSHQVWSWYDHLLPSYSVLDCWYVTWPWPLTFWPWTVVIHGESCDQRWHQVWRPSWVTSYNVSHWLPLKMRTRPLRMRRITWPMSSGWKTITFLEPRPRFASSLCNFGGSTMNIIKVICENNARPCINKTYEILRMREITWSVKGVLNVLLQSFSSTSIYSIRLQQVSI